MNDDEAEKLRKEIEGLKEELRKKDNKITELEKEKDRLEKRLRFFEGPHVPSSKQGFKAKSTSLEKTLKKRGAPVGHKGVTRRKPEPTETIPVYQDSCPHCHSTDIEMVGTQNKDIEEIPDPLPIRFIRFLLAIYLCHSCGMESVAKHEACPQKGRFGVTFLALVIFLKIFMRGVMRKVPTFLQTQNGITASAATINNILERVAAAGESEFEAIRDEIRKCSHLSIDETSFSVLGKNWWMWIFHSNDKILVVIRNSRGSSVLEEILGKEWKGFINCDGWSAYGRLINAILQRCWAHLLREAKDCARTVAGIHLQARLTSIFHRAKNFSAEKHTEKERIAEAKKLENETMKLVKYYSKYPELEGICTYIRNGGADWFTAVRYEGIELTNNRAERGLREQVVMRNIMGAMRSAHVHKYEVLCSLFSTWHLNKQDCMSNLKRILSAKLCLS
ncbi:TPA: IS66 family transposase [Candidatus Micrarchaeota archaeon]|nr:IS66 family transposase [Candidatus Micrarchaeota archaeon]